MVAPDFTTVDQFGQTQSLSQYRGHYVLLYFYPKDDSPGCTVEACGLRDNYAELLQHVIVLGISPDTLESHRRFTEKHSLPFPLLVDTSKEIIQSYGTNGVLLPKRVSFLISPEGKIMKIYDKINVKKHASQVLKDMQQMASLHADDIRNA